MRSFCLRIDDALYRRARVAAAVADVSMNQWISDLINAATPASVPPPCPSERPVPSAESADPASTESAGLDECIRPV